MPLPVTFADRFRAAYAAFKQNTKPDPDALDRFLHERQEKRNNLLGKLDPYDKALVVSVASGTENAEMLLTQVMPAIERLDASDQAHVVLYIVSRNPGTVGHHAIRNWSIRRENFRAVAQAFADREEIVVVS